MRGLSYKLLLLPLLLVGCTPGVGIKTQIVTRPVLLTEKCIKKEDIPTLPKPLHDTAIPSDLETALSLTLAKISEWAEYGHQADTVIQNCK